VNSCSEPDVSVRQEGSIFLLHPRTPAARDWFDEHIAEDSPWWCGRLVVEHGYADAILEGIVNHGLSVGG
jgi:hypothetical protein